MQFIRNYKKKLYYAYVYLIDIYLTHILLDRDIY